MEWNRRPVLLVLSTRTSAPRKEFQLDFSKGRWTIGGDKSSSHLIIKRPGIHPQHCSIIERIALDNQKQYILANHVWSIEPLTQSSVLHNNRPMEQSEEPLKDGDTIQVCGRAFQFKFMDNHSSSSSSSFSSTSTSSSSSSFASLEIQKYQQLLFQKDEQLREKDRLLKKKDYEIQRLQLEIQKLKQIRVNGGLEDLKKITRDRTPLSPLDPDDEDTTRKKGGVVRVYNSLLESRKIKKRERNSIHSQSEESGDSSTMEEDTWVNGVDPIDLTKELSDDEEDSEDPSTSENDTIINGEMFLDVTQAFSDEEDDDGSVRFEDSKIYVQ